MEATKGFDQWAILEIMGHNVFAGKVSEQTVGGASFVRVDVPAVNGLQAFTKLFGASSIYCITPVSEEVAIARATSLRQQPMSVYDLPPDVKEAMRAARLKAPQTVPSYDGDEAEPGNHRFEDEPDYE